MAHYALLDENSIVVEVITGVNENTTQVDTDGTVVGGSTEAWEAYYASLPWFSGLTCKRTSYNTCNNQYTGIDLEGKAYRGNFAGIGYKYLPEHDIFIPPQPYLNCILNLDIANWVCQEIDEL